MSYNNVYLHIVFAVKYRKRLVNEEMREMIQGVMVNVCKKHGFKKIEIYCNPDHVHLLVQNSPTTAISTLIQDLKVKSNLVMNRYTDPRRPFKWQREYAVHGHTVQHIARIAEYIRNQPEHHKAYTFEEELRLIFGQTETEYNEEYLTHILPEMETDDE